MNSNNLDVKKKNILKLFKEKKFSKVIKLGTQQIKKNSNDADLLYVLGFSAINLQNYIDAEKYFKKLLDLKKTAYIFYVYGNIQSKLKNYQEAIVSFESALSLNPKLSEAYNNLANANKSINNINEAIKNYQKSIEKDKKNLTAYFNLAVLLKENKQYWECKKIYEKILLVDTNNLTAKHDLGAIESILGNFNSARNYFIDVINTSKTNYKSFKNYIEITNIDKKDHIFKKLKNIQVVNVPTESQIDIYYSLSKGYFDIGEKTEGFTNLEKGKKIKKKLSKFSIKREKKQFENLKNYFNTHNLIEIKNLIKINKIPIFILGMPRSGTTLIEQILSAHTKIFGAGELTYLPKIIDKLYLKDKMIFNDTINEIRSLYSRAISNLSDRPIIIDKLPLNFKWIGFIIKSFPESKIIHLNRNPMAVCWSNYKTNFRDSGMEFTLSQDDLAEYYILYHELMNFWKSLFDKKIININYENFVKDYEKNTRDIINNLDLKWEDGIKNYKNIDKPVATASLHQVRGKILKNTSDQWKQYRENLFKIQTLLKSKNINF